MTIVTKVILIVAFFALIIALLSALPLTADHPLDPTFALAVGIIFTYLYQWAQVFTAINYLLYVALASIGLELGIVLWRFAAWIIGKVAARFV